MDWIFYVVIGILIILQVLSSTKAKSMNKENMNKPLPYKKRDDFLSEAERMFYLTMSNFIEDKATICPKVAVKEIVFIGKGTGKEYMKYFNWIAKKHVDFIICDSVMMNVLCAVELDDSSHSKTDRKKRDEFVDKVFETAKIPLFHLPLKNGYSALDFEPIMSIINAVNNTIPSSNIEAKQPEILNNITSQIPVCPKCGVDMVKRKASRGENSGTEFYGCQNYPKCREIKPLNSIE